jgi:HAD superfamily hydrolase (TIGR01549 family)
MVKAVTLDFWNTLFVDGDGPQLEQRRMLLLKHELAALGTPRSEAAIGTALRTVYAWFERIWRGEQRTPSAAEALAVLFAALTVSPPAVVVRRVVNAFEQLVLDPPPALVPGVSSVLPQLAAVYRLGIICDTGYAPGRVLRQLLAEQGLLQFFSSVYFSNEGSSSKPDRRVFLRVLAEIGVRPSESVHVGDSVRTDITGAHQAGMLAVHFIGVSGDGSSGTAGPDGMVAAGLRDDGAAVSSGDVVIAHFTDLPAALVSLARSTTLPR